MSDLPADVLSTIDANDKKRESRAQLIAEEERKTQEEAERLQKYIYDNANPDPILVIGIGLVVLVVLWLLHTLYLKSSMSGHWLDAKNNQWSIWHNPFTGLLVMHTGGKKHAGYIQDNLFKCGDLIGVWNYKHIVLFVNSDLKGLTRVINE